MPRYRVLVVDDEEFVRESLVDLLDSDDYRARAAPNGKAALELVEKESFHLIVTDLQMPEGDGMSLLAGVRERGLDTPVVLLTGVGTVKDAVAAMKAGAFDFIQKPVDPEQFMLVVKRAIEHGRLVSEVQYLRETVNDLRGPTEMVGVSPAIRQIRSLIDKVAPSDATVVVTGESGTGKELAALEIHKRSNRATGNLVEVNCAALSETLFESEFFGHRRGAFTSAVEDRRGRFREAEGGTLVLDEIGTLRPEMQAKLLRVLETGEYQVVGESKTRIADVRLIAITNENLEKRVQEGGFREDLFYRLNIFPIEMPPLRERREDLAVLANHFLLQCCKSRDEDISTICDESLALLAGHDWPGNVRELRNLIERSTILADSRVPSPEVFRAVLSTVPGARMNDADGRSDDDLQIRSRIEKLERSLIHEALDKTRGRKRDACELLGINPKNLSYYMRKHGISERPDDGGESASR